MNKRLDVFLLLTLLSLASVASADDKAETVKYATKAPAPAFTILPPEVSVDLKILKVPTSEPAPLTIGTYWDCEINEHRFEVCDFKIVVCTNDQTFCTTVN